MKVVIYDLFSSFLFAFLFSNSGERDRNEAKLQRLEAFSIISPYVHRYAVTRKKKERDKKMTQKYYTKEDTKRWHKKMTQKNDIKGWHKKMTQKYYTKDDTKDNTKLSQANDF